MSVEYWLEYSVVKKMTLNIPETVVFSIDCIQRTESVFNEARYSETSPTYAAPDGNCLCVLVFSFGNHHHLCVSGHFQLNLGYPLFSAHLFQRRTFWSRWHNCYRPDSLFVTQLAVSDYRWKKFNVVGSWIIIIIIIVICISLLYVIIIIIRIHFKSL